MATELKRIREDQPTQTRDAKENKTKNGDYQINRQKIANAIDALDWNWLQDKKGTFIVNMAADDTHGGLETQYMISLQPEMDNAIVLRLYALPWFSGVPQTVSKACDEWNGRTPYPKALVLKDDDGDGKLALEWVIPCWYESIEQSLVNRWIEDFARGCASFLYQFNEALQDAPRYVPIQASSIH